MSSPPTKLRLNDLWGPCPPDGYRYVFEEDGYLVHAWTYVDWIGFALNHLEANKGSDAFPNHIEPAELESRMQEQLCKTLPPGWCMYDDPNRPRPVTSLSWNDVAGALTTFGRWIARGCNYVLQNEADRRALICSRCYLNVQVQGCSGCQKAVEEVVRNKHSKFDNALRSCAVCRCFLRAKVHFPLDVLESSTGSHQDMYPDFCWLKRGGSNYLPLDKPGEKAEKP